MRILFAVLLSLLATMSHAFERPFPAAAKRGEMVPQTYPDILLNGKPRTLSVAARIWNTHNMLVLPAYLPRQAVVVNYTQDRQGQIDKVWILSTEEAAKPAPGTTPSP